MARVAGFTLIEVLIAILILSFGLLGMALLQAVSLRASQSSNYRTQATNMAYQIIDMIRANRQESGNYGLIEFSNTIGLLPNTNNGTYNCLPGATLTGARWQQDRVLWLCSVMAALPGGQGRVVVTSATTTVPGTITVSLQWLDDRSQATAGAQQNLATDFQVISSI